MNYSPIITCPHLQQLDIPNNFTYKICIECQELICQHPWQYIVNNPLTDKEKRDINQQNILDRLKNSIGTKYCQICRTNIPKSYNMSYN